MPDPVVEVSGPGEKLVYASLSKMLVNTSTRPAKILLKSERQIVCTASLWIRRM